jgi:hypothetical protein
MQRSETAKPVHNKGTDYIDEVYQSKKKSLDVNYSSDSINLVPVCDVRVDMDAPDCVEN